MPKWVYQLLVRIAASQKPLFQPAVKRVPPAVIQNNQAEGLIKLVIIALNKVVFVEPSELSIFIFFCGSVAPAIHDS